MRSPTHGGPRGAAPWRLSGRGSKGSARTNDWAAAEATRRERYPGDAPVDFDILASATFPKVIVSGAWPPDIAPGRERARDALNDVADVVAARIGAERVVFPRSSHGPQWEEPQAFNEFLRKLWTSA